MSWLFNFVNVFVVDVMGNGPERLDQMSNSLLKFSGHLLISVLFLLLDVVEHDSFLVHHFHVIICGVWVSRNWKSNLSKVMSWLTGTTMIHDIPINNQAHLIEFTENFGWRLMDSWNNCSSGFCQLIQKTNQIQGSGWIKPSCGFVQKDDWRVD